MIAAEASSALCKSFPGFCVICSLPSIIKSTCLDCISTKLTPVHRYNFTFPLSYMADSSSLPPMGDTHTEHDEPGKMRFAPLGI